MKTKPKPHAKSKKKSFDLDTFAAYKTAKAEGDTRKASRLRDKLISDNMKLVHNFAHRQMKATSVHIELEDLVQAGAIGMMNALERFDPSKASFSTYAAFYIRNEIVEAVLKEHNVYRPKGAGKPYKVHRAQEAHLARTGEHATADDLHVKAKDLDKWDTEGNTYFSLDAVEGLGGYEWGVPSDVQQVIEHVAHSSPDPEQQLIERDMDRQLPAAMKVLDDRDRRIIEGIFVAEKMHEKIAREEDISLEWVRQLRNSALEILREELS